MTLKIARPIVLADEVDEEGGDERWGQIDRLTERVRHPVEEDVADHASADARHRPENQASGDVEAAPGSQEDSRDGEDEGAGEVECEKDCFLKVHALLPFRLINGAPHTPVGARSALPTPDLSSRRLVTTVVSPRRGGSEPGGQLSWKLSGFL